MAKINTGYSAFSSGPVMDLTPHDDAHIPDMNTSIPSVAPEMGALADSPYDQIGMYGSPSTDSEDEEEE